MACSWRTVSPNSYKRRSTAFSGGIWKTAVTISATTTALTALYGWRLYGDYGVLEGTNYYPPYYAARLMQNFVQPGDTVISAISDYMLLATYAVRRQDGSMTILTINKDPTHTFTGRLALNGFTPASSGTIYSYGIPQDNAAEFGVGSPDVAQTNLSGAGTNFSYAFLLIRPPCSRCRRGRRNCWQFHRRWRPINSSSNSGASLAFLTSSSARLIWSTGTSVSTNKLLSGTLQHCTNSLVPSAPQQFWRAIWQP